MKLDEFTEQYIETALWSTNDESTPQGGEPLDAHYSIEDIAPETLAQMVADCVKFQSENAADLEAGYEATGKGPDNAGHDFWLTRVKAGCGFWETPDWPEEIGKRLTAAANKFGEFSLYVGDDGKIYS